MEKLAKALRAIAMLQGHKMELWRKQHFYGGCWTSFCLKCGFGISIFRDPPPNTDTVGYTSDDHECKGESNGQVSFQSD